MNQISVPMSPGELIDKITILEIKLAHIREAAKRVNVANELTLLMDTWLQFHDGEDDITTEWQQLREINQQLWDIEDAIRMEEKNQRFGAEFVRLARAVYMTNDERARVKKVINLKLGSVLIEEKSYASYRAVSA